MAHATEHWTEILPSILLGLRVTVRENIGYSPSEMVYGSTLRLPVDFFYSSLQHSTNPTSFVTRLKDNLKRIRAIPDTHHSRQKVFISPELDVCTHVFLCRDSVSKALQPPYDGPYQVITRHDKYFTILYNGKNLNVSKGRLKPAFLLPDDSISIDHSYAKSSIGDIKFMKGSQKRKHVRFRL